MLFKQGGIADVGDEVRARLATRASPTALVHGLPECADLLAEATDAHTAATLVELGSLTLCAVRLAALALDADPADVLAVLLVERKPTEAEKAA
jgi:hypothetical protein